MNNNAPLFVLSASTPTGAPLHGGALVTARAGADARFRRGIDLHAEFDLTAKLDASYRNGFVAALEGGASIGGKLAFQACLPIDLFDEAGLVSRLEISAEAIAHVSATLGLEFGEFKQLIREQTGDGPLADLVQVLTEEAIIQAGFWAQAGLAAAVRGQASFTGSLLPGAIHGAGFSYDFSYGGGFGFGTGMNFRVNIGFEDPGRLISRVADVLVDLSAVEANRIIASLGDSEAAAAARSLELLKPLLRLSIHTAFRMGIDLANEPRDRAGTVVSSTVEKLAREAQNTLLNAAIELALDRLRQFFQSHDLEYAFLELDEQSRTDVITGLTIVKDRVSDMVAVSPGSAEWLESVHHLATALEDLLAIVPLEQELKQYLHVSLGILASATALLARIASELSGMSTESAPLVTGDPAAEPTSNILGRALGSAPGTAFVLTDLASFLIDQEFIEEAVYRVPALGAILDFLQEILSATSHGEVLHQVLIILDHFDQTAAQQLVERLSPTISRAVNEQILPDLIEPLKQEGHEPVIQLIDEIVIPTLTTVPEVVIPRLADLTTPEAGKRLSEAVSAVLLQSLRRFVIVTADVLSKYALENGENTLRHLASEIRQAGERQPIVAAVAALWLPLPIAVPVRIGPTDVALLLELVADITQRVNGLSNPNRSPRRDLINLLDLLFAFGLDDPVTRNTSLARLTLTDDRDPNLDKMLTLVGDDAIDIATFVVPKTLNLVVRHYENEATIIAAAIHEGGKAVVAAVEESVRWLARSMDELKRQIEVLALQATQFAAQIAGEIKMLAERLRNLEGMFIERIRELGWSIIEPLVSWAPPEVVAGAHKLYDELFDGVKVLLDLPLAVLSEVAGWLQEGLTTHLQGASVNSEHIQEALRRRILSAECPDIGISFDHDIGLFRINLGTIVIARGNILGELAKVVFDEGTIESTVTNCAQAAIGLRNAETQRITLQSRLDKQYDEYQANAMASALTTGRPLNINVSLPASWESYVNSVPIWIQINGANLSFVQPVLGVPRRISIRINGREYPYTANQWEASDNNTITFTAVVRLAQRELPPQSAQPTPMLMAPVEPLPIVDLSGRAIVSRNGRLPYVSSRPQAINRWRTEELDSLATLPGVRIIGRVRRGAVFAIPSAQNTGMAQFRSAMLPSLGSALEREQYLTVAPHPNGMRAAARLAEELGSGKPPRPVFTPGGTKAPLRGNPGLNILQVAVSDAKDAAHQYAVAVPFFLTKEGSVNQPIKVEEIMYNPRGRDLEAGERVILRSTSALPLDLTGWTIRDLARHTFQFPNRFILQPGATVTIYTRAGANDSASLYWGLTRPVWNNRGDALVLRDVQGNIVAHYAYH